MRARGGEEGEVKASSQWLDQRMMSAYSVEEWKSASRKSI